MPGPVLLFDGTCGFCAASVQMVLRHDRRGVLRFAPLQGTYASALRSRHPELSDVDSMIWVDPAGEEGEHVFVRSAAALRVARYLGGMWRLALIAGILPRGLRDAAYALVARHRHHLRAAAPVCLVPGPEVRARFLE
jgi:predicted DCC family thiol-disulfide oxidoreductase YuxK